jgi:hypothetical protein
VSSTSIYSYSTSLSALESTLLDSIETTTNSHARAGMSKSLPNSTPWWLWLIVGGSVVMCCVIALVATVICWRREVVRSTDESNSASFFDQLETASANSVVDAFDDSIPVYLFKRSISNLTFRC